MLYPLSYGGGISSKTPPDHVGLRSHQRPQIIEL